MQYFLYIIFHADFAELSDPHPPPTPYESTVMCKSMTMPYVSYEFILLILNPPFCTVYINYSVSEKRMKYWFVCLDWYTIQVLNVCSITHIQKLNKDKGIVSWGWMFFCFFPNSKCKLTSGTTLVGRQA